MKSFLAERHFSVKIGFSPSKIVKTGVPQGTISSPLLFNLYTAVQPSSESIIQTDIVDDKALISSNSNYINDSGTR